MLICFDIDKNFQGSKMYLCASFGCSTPNGVGGAHRYWVKPVFYISITNAKRKESENTQKSPYLGFSSS